MSFRAKLLSLIGYQLTGSVGLILLGTISSIFYARFLGPAEFGRMNFIYWILSLAGVVVGLGFNGTLSRYVAYHHGKNEQDVVNRIVNVCLWTEVVLALLLTSLLWYFTEAVNAFFQDPLLSTCFSVLLLTIVPASIGDALRFTLTGLQRVKQLAVNNIAFQACTLVGNVLLLLAGYGLKEIFYLNLLIVIARAFSLWWLLSGTVHIGCTLPDRPLLVELGRYNLTLAIIVITDQVIWQRSEVFFLQKFSTPDEIAYYSLAFGWGMRVIGFLPGILGAFLIPVMAAMHGNNEDAKIHKGFYFITKYSSLVLIPLTIGMLAINDNFIHLLYGADYQAVPALMIPIFLSKGFISLYVAASAVIFASGRQTFIMRWGLVLAALNLVLDFFLIRDFGALGAAWATSIVHFLAAAITLVYITRYLKLRVPFVFQFKLTLICLAIYPPTAYIANHLMNPAGLVLAIGFFTLLYLWVFRLVGGVSDEDRDTLLFFDRQLPPWLRPAYQRYFNL